VLALYTMANFAMLVSEGLRIYGPG
jgi:hypothetical protein